MTAISDLLAFFQKVQAWYVSAADWLSSPLWRWYFYGIALLFVCSLILWFFGWLKAVRIVVSVAVLLAAAFIAGGKVMYEEMKKKLDEERAKQRVRDQEQRQDNNWGGGWFGNWQR